MILLTGASGFIGKHLLFALVKKFGTDKVFALTSKPIDNFNYILHNNYKFDADYFFLQNLSDRITTIIHAGAFIPKNGADVNNVFKCNQNIYNTEKLLSSELPKLKNIIYISSIDVYSNDLMISENTQLNPPTLYGFSKLYCEKMIEAFAKKNEICCQILRLGHVYGPGEEAFQKLIPVTFNKIFNKQPIQIWGSGNETRAFINIKDVVESIIRSLSYKTPIGPINIVSERTITIKDLINIIVFTSGDSSPIEYIETKVAERNLVFNNAKMKEYLLEKEINLELGLKEEYLYMKNLLTND